MSDEKRFIDNSEQMPSLQKINGISLSAAMHTGIGIAPPFMKEIYLKDQHIVGTRYVGGPEEIIKDLKPGDKVQFLREPDNAYDPRAIMALDEQGRKLGYIPRYENEIPGALLDAGKHLYGIVRESRIDTSGKSWTSIIVEMYMREFSMPGEPFEIPKQGHLGSYAVIDLQLFSGKNKTGIRSLYAIKVINGEERDSFFMELHRADGPVAVRDLVSAFSEFAGYLPIVGHGLEGEKEKALAELYGTMLGRSFSNQVIDTRNMAAIHMQEQYDLSLEALVEELGITDEGTTEAEVRCRQVWKLYCRFETSDFTRRGFSHKHEKYEDYMDLPLDDYPLTADTRCIVDENKILTVRELCMYTERHLKSICGSSRESYDELLEVADQAGAKLRPEQADIFLYGYPETMKELAFQKGTVWKGLLYYEVFMVNYERLQKVRDHRILLWHRTEYCIDLSDFSKLRKYMAFRMDEISKCAANIIEVIGKKANSALGSIGEPGDAEVIVEAAEEAAEIYRKLLLWRREFTWISAPPKYHKILEALLRSSESLLTGFDELYQEMAKLKETLYSCRNGDISIDELPEIKLNFKLVLKPEEIAAALYELLQSEEK